MDGKVVSFKRLKYEKAYQEFYKSYRNLGFFNKYDIVKPNIKRVKRII